MSKEFQALDLNQTWYIIHFSLGKKVITCKWVYKIKQKSVVPLSDIRLYLWFEGTLRKLGLTTLRLSFRSIVKFSTIKCLLVITAKKSWTVFQLDVNNAFLHGDLSEKVYMKIPPGLIISSPSDSSGPLVCHLKKSLYGLKQALLQWFAKLSQALLSRGYSSSLNDYSLLPNILSHQLL